MSTGRLTGFALAGLLASGAAAAGSPSADAEAAILARLTGAASPSASLMPSLPAFARVAPPARAAVPEAARRALVPLAEAAAALHGLDAAFFKRLIHQESGYNPLAVSRAGAQGIAQFMPGTAASVGLDDPFDPNKALPKSAEHLAGLRSRLGNDGLAAAAYNAGEGRVRAWLAGRAALPSETVSYVAAVTGRPAADWAPAGAVLLAGPALPGAVPPLLARAGSAEWQFGLSLMGGQGARLAALMAAPKPAAATSRPGGRAARRFEGGERALCATVGCIVSSAY